MSYGKRVNKKKSKIEFQKGIYGLTDKDGNSLYVSLCDLPSKSSDDTLAVLKEIFDDIGAREVETERQRNCSRQSRTP